MSVWVSIVHSQRCSSHRFCIHLPVHLQEQAGEVGVGPAAIGSERNRLAQSFLGGPIITAFAGCKRLDFKRVDVRWSVAQDFLGNRRGGIRTSLLERLARRDDARISVVRGHGSCLTPLP